MSHVKVQIADLGGVINDQLVMYHDDINKQLHDIGSKHMKELVRQTKATAPVGKRKKHYRDSIKSKTIKTTRTTRHIWYVDGPDYRLSHLLEKGHALRNGGRTQGTHFIQNATEPILEAYVQEVEEVIKNG